MDPVTEGGVDATAGTGKVWRLAMRGIATTDSHDDENGEIKEIR